MKFGQGGAPDEVGGGSPGHIRVRIIAFQDFRCVPVHDAKALQDGGEGGRVIGADMSAFAELLPADTTAAVTALATTTAVAATVTAAAATTSRL